MLGLSWFNQIVQETIVGTSGFPCLCSVQDEGMMIQDEFVSRWSLLELFQIHSRIKADLPDPLHLGSGEEENLPTPGLGAGRGGASSDPWTLGSGESEHLPTPGLGVGRGGTTPPKCPALLTPRLGVGRGGFSLRVGQGGATPSKGRAQPTPGLRVGLASDSAAPVSIQISLDFKAIPARTPQRDKTLPRFSCSNPS